jgi:hypothetical protein
MANKFKSYMTLLGTTDLTTLLTATNTSVFIIGSIRVTNIHASTTSTIVLSITDTSAATTHAFVQDLSIAPADAESYKEILTRPIILENLDVLKAQAADASVFDVIVSYIDRDRT